LKAFKDAMESLIGVPLSVSDATTHYADSLAKLTKRAGEAKGKGLNPLSEEGRTNREALSGAAHSALDLASAQREMDGDSQRAVGTLRQTRKALIDQATAFTGNREAAEKYVDELGLTEEHINAVATDKVGSLKVDGVDVAQQQTGTLVGTMTTITKGARGPVSVDGADTAAGEAGKLAGPLDNIRAGAMAAIGSVGVPGTDKDIAGVVAILDNVRAGAVAAISSVGVPGTDRTLGTIIGDLQTIGRGAVANIAATGVDTVRNALAGIRDALFGVSNGATAQIGIIDYASAVIQGVLDKIREVVRALANPFSLVVNSVFNNAAGGVYAAFARGGEHHVAQIGTGAVTRVWNEPETGGEAYIPLSPAKRDRSTAILGVVADRFGYDLQRRFADGGLFGARPAVSAGAAVVVSAGAFQVVINNNGSPERVSAADLRPLVADFARQVSRELTTRAR
jgi:hypothetical protein